MPGTLQDYAHAVHDIISVCRDAEQGFRGAAQAVNAPAMKEMFEEYSVQRAGFAAELQAAEKALGFESTNPQGMGGLLHASWMSLKGMVTGHSVHAILVDTERGADYSINTYRAAMDKTLPPEFSSIIEKQFEEVQKAHDRIRLLRDATAPKSDTPEKEKEPPKTVQPTGEQMHRVAPPAMTTEP